MKVGEAEEWEDDLQRLFWEVHATNTGVIGIRLIFTSNKFLTIQVHAVNIPFINHSMRF